MNCPKCFNGVLELSGKTTMTISLLNNVIKMIEVDVLICSLDQCSHIQISGPKNLLLGINATRAITIASRSAGSGVTIPLGRVQCLRL